MPLLQASVLKNYLSQQDSVIITSAHAEYTAYFHNSTIQASILNKIEQQFQEGFLGELFVIIFGNFTKIKSTNKWH